MNCFEWQSRSSDFLDGTLMGALRLDADQHLGSCLDCRDRHQHYRLILTQIASQSRVSLPAPLRKAPLSAILPAPESLAGGAPSGFARAARARWERVPWLLRTTLEGSGIVLLILVGINAAPRVRKLYERRVEQNLNEFSDSFSAAENTAPGSESLVAPVPLARGKVPVEAGGADAGGDEYSGENESADDDEVASEETAGGNLHVGNSEIWRFNLKTDSPHEIRPRIVQLLVDLHVPSSTPGFGGIEAPGGIQFDLLVSKSVVLELKKQLQKLAPRQAPALASADSLASEAFTWYKNKSKRKIPDGQGRVVIWLSQM